jgi:glycosyltransferase involved in cell wall biosynthesis
VVLPTFNRLYCLPRAVESVLRQTFTDIELIVVDDGSSDGTMDYLRTVSDPRLRVLRHEVNKHGAAARNTGIAAARAPWIAFQDSDDEWLVTMLERQVARVAEAGPEYGASYCGKIVYGRDDNFNFSSRRAAYMPSNSGREHPRRGSASSDHQYADADGSQGHPRGGRRL